MKNRIIGIAGELNSGKDTLASMINYIIGNGATKANYQNWLTYKKKWDATYADRITHFADPMKDCLSIMYNIPREYFEDREYKDNKYYSIHERIYFDENDIQPDNCKYKVITNIHLQTYNLNELIRNISSRGYYPVIKLRTLMQYFGTEIGRNMMQDNLWVNATIGRAATIAESRGICIIPDLRFTNERDSIRGNLLYGGDILIKRNSSDETKHSSETIDFDCKYTIDNNGTKMQLFYQAINICHNIFKTN